jgi:Nif-specific regulatory protein
MSKKNHIPDDEQCQSCALKFAYDEISILYEIAVMLTNTTDTKECIEKSMLLLKRKSYLERCTLFLLNDEGEYLELFASINITPAQQKMARYKIGEGATGLAAKSAEPIVIENIHNNINYLNKIGTVNTKSISYVATPIIQDSGVIGVLSANIDESSVINFDNIVHMLTIVGSLFGGNISMQKKFAKEKESLVELKTYYKDQALSEYRFENIIGKSSKMKLIFNMLETVSPSDATILVRGETGTGKELIATAVHNLSRRKNAPFIKLNCAAISETLLESELFGHEKGAFTDAKESRKGRFELADGGTLFLDEIGDITPSLQVKLLRILQEQEFERVGGTKTIKTNVRLVAATNRNLEKMVKSGEFREDLFYRLNVIPINLPPLRERYEDVKLLIEHCLYNFTKEHKKEMFFSKQALEILLDYPWPGNIRELQNTMERIVLICPNGVITPEMLNHVMPFNYQKMHMSMDSENTVIQKESLPAQNREENALPQILTKNKILEIEKESIIKALVDSRGIKTKAAAQLGMSTRQITYKIKKYNIEF